MLNESLALKKQVGEKREMDELSGKHGIVHVP